MKATQTPRLHSRLRGVSHMLIDFQPWEETVLQKTSLLPHRTTGTPRDTSPGFGHLSWLLASASYAGFLCSYKPHLQSDKFPAELGTHFPYYREEINSSLRGMAVFNLHGLDTIPKFKLGKMFISAKHFLSKSSFINGI